MEAMDKGATEAHIQRMLLRLHAHKRRGWTRFAAPKASSRSIAPTQRSTSRLSRVNNDVTCHYRPLFLSNDGMLDKLKSLAERESAAEKVVGVGSCDLTVVEVGGWRPAPILWIG